jgi:hypothetical protein
LLFTSETFSTSFFKNVVEVVNRKEVSFSCPAFCYFISFLTVIADMSPDFWHIFGPGGSCIDIIAIAISIIGGDSKFSNSFTSNRFAYIRPYLKNINLRNSE